LKVKGKGTERSVPFSVTQVALSISFRLRRTTTEEGYISVPVTPDLLKPRDKDDGVLDGEVLDVEKVVERALSIGKESEIDWQPETDPEIVLHPLQKARPTSDQ